MSSTPLKTSLPKLVDPRKFAQQGLSLKGKVTVEQLVRLPELVLNPNAEVTVDLQFEIDEENIRSVTGKAQCELEVTCQRCLEAVAVPVEADIHLAIVWDEDKAKNLPKRFDPWIAEEGQNNLYEVIEEELLLNLPMVAYHDYECVEASAFTTGEFEEVEEDKPNPFQVLEQLKGSPKS